MESWLIDRYNIKTSLRCDSDGEAMQIDFSLDAQGFTVKMELE